MLAFPIALVLAFGLVCGTFLRWTPPPEPVKPVKDPAESPAPASFGSTSSGVDEHAAPTPPAGDPKANKKKPGVLDDLTHLGSTYDFKASVVTNVTALGALLTGVLGSSDVIEAALGEDAKSQIGLATVGAAVAIALIGAGTIVPLALKAKDAKTHKVLGILLGFSVTLAGAFGQLWVTMWTGIELDLGALAWILLAVAFVLAVVLLGFYARTALVATLNQGVLPPKDEPSDAVEAAELIVTALRVKDDIDEEVVDRALKDVRSRYPGRETSAGDDPFPRRTGAAL